MLNQATVARWRREAATMDPKDRTTRRARLEDLLKLSRQQRRARGHTGSREQLEVALACLIEAGA